VSYILGAPGPHTVPLVVLDKSSRWAAYRDIELGATDPARAGVPVSGWIRTDAFRGPAGLAVCSADAAKGGGAVIEFETRDAFEVQLEKRGPVGAPLRVGQTRARMRLDGPNACLLAVAGEVGSAAEPGFLRVDLVKKLGELRMPKEASTTGQRVSCDIAP
jgi:hypothetical protein